MYQIDGRRVWGEIRQDASRELRGLVEVRTRASTVFDGLADSVSTESATNDGIWRIIDQWEKEQ